jgi:hypothetical protein
MAPPPGHLLAQTAVTDEPVTGGERSRTDWGDRYPSDTGDTLIETQCPDGADVDLFDEEAPLLAEFRRRERDKPDDETKDAGGGGGGSSQDDEDEQDAGGCGGAVGVGCCIYRVTVTFATPTRIFNEVGSGEPPTETTQGARGGLSEVCCTFEKCTEHDFRPAAEAVFQGYAAEIQRKHAEMDWVVGENGPWLVNFLVVGLNPNRDPGSNCDGTPC